jgi:hypothetical protein
MEFHDPRGQLTGPIDAYRAAATLDAGQTVGLFANGFPDSVNFLEHVGAAIERELPGVSVQLWNKGNASALASEEHLAQITASCSAVVAAYGH